MLPKAPPLPPPRKTTPALMTHENRYCGFCNDEGGGEGSSGMSLRFYPPHPPPPRIRTKSLTFLASPYLYHLPFNPPLSFPWRCRNHNIRGSGNLHYASIQKKSPYFGDSKVPLNTQEKVNKKCNTKQKSKKSAHNIVCTQVPI